ncbi:MAG: hypothetical protein WC379_09890 [Methanoregula sp.]
MQLRKIVIALLALLLAGVVMVPCVSAADTIMTESQTKTPLHNQIPTGYLQNWKEASPLPESEIYSVIVPESSISKTDDPKGIYLIDFTISEKSIQDSFVKNPDYPGYLVSKNLQKDSRAVLFRIPKTMYEYFVKNSDNGKLTFPQQFFKTYSTIDELIEESNDLEKETAISSVSPIIPASPPMRLPDRTGYSLTYNPNKLGWHNEWITFNQSGTHNVIYITGKITPNMYYLDTNDRYQVYQERELYMDDSNDAIELVVTFHDMNDGANMLLFPAIWDNGVLTDIDDWDYNDGFVTIPLNSVPHEYEYYAGLGIDDNPGIYEIWFQDVSASDWYYYLFDDTDNPAYHYNRITGSSEFLWNTVTSGFFVARTIPIKDEWNYDGSSWFYPRQVWQYENKTDNEDYVNIDWSWYPDANGNLLVTNSYCDSR